MTDSSMLVASIDAQLAELVRQHRARIATLPSLRDDLRAQLDAVFDHAERFTAGGKRLRAQFCAAGCRIGGLVDSPAIALAGAALEFFHAAALAHDDIIDRSDTRRGAPSSHRAFEAHHRSLGWTRDAEHIGESAAILFGDLLLTWSDDLFVAACAAVDADAGAAARSEISRMRTELTLGQYLDVVEEVAWPTVPVEARADRALSIATSKSARYSIEAPLVIGARLAGAGDELVEQIREFGLPLGLAFQLRDDVLGVFGDAELMGKPAGDDLREGKRTWLIARVEARSDAATREWFDERLGRADLDSLEIERMQRAIRTSGALDDVEAKIASLLASSLEALDRTGLDAESHALISGLAQRTANRVV